MRLYEDDCNVLTKEEKVIYEKYLADTAPGKAYSSNIWHDLPFKIKNYISLFPNYYLNIDIINNKEYINKITSEYLNLINCTDTTELKLKKFIKDNRYYPIVGAILQDYNFGHHGAYLIPEFQLNTEYKADYLIIGENSDGVHFIFVEMESINDCVYIGNGDYSDCTRKGINQVKDWKRWLQSNFNKLDFYKYCKQNERIPREFDNYDNSRIHYVVVVGRREYYIPKFRDLIRMEKDESKISVIHHEHLYDNLKKINDNPHKFTY